MIYTEATTADRLRPGDDVVSMTAGRFTVESVTPADHGMVRVVSTHGLKLIVSGRQLFRRYVSRQTER